MLVRDLATHQSFNGPVEFGSTQVGPINGQRLHPEQIVGGAGPGAFGVARANAVPLADATVVRAGAAPGLAVGIGAIAAPGYSMVLVGAFDTISVRVWVVAGRALEERDRGPGCFTWTCDESRVGARGRREVYRRYYDRRSDECHTKHAFRSCNSV
jgi:hypothetical protein